MTSSERQVLHVTQLTRLEQCVEVERMAANYGPDLLLVVDPSGALRFASRSSERVLGLDPEQHLGSLIFDWVHPDDLEKAVGAFDEASRTSGGHLPVHVRVHGAPHKSWVHCEVTAETVVVAGEPWMVLALRPVGGRTDVTDRREAISQLILSSSPTCASVGWRAGEAAVRRVLARLADVLGAEVATLVGGAGADREPRAVEWVDDSTVIDGHEDVTLSLWPPGEMTTGLIRFTTDLRGMPVCDQRDRLLGAGMSSVVEVPLRGSSASVLRLAFRDWSRWDDSNTDLVRLLATTLDSTLLRTSMEKELYEQSRRDSLTGLINGRELLAMLAQRLKRAERAGRPESVGVIYGDLVGFKAINDSLGHAEGDRLLVAVAEALIDSLRDGDLVARMGGDEFAVVCSRLTAPDDLEVVSGRLAAAVRGLGTDSTPVSISLGSAVAQDGEAAHVLLARADLEMLRSKAARAARP